ncbi:DUF58 domain-containing protein [Sphaerisporangium album]|uniref:DUF58 domain-containing protein n=1 Tax=Sphaerisporangium album TaxID=509200 RepID=UPI0015F0A95A|nr:DUF58 domain-containing protein [Sphaerisporangium album]
MRSPTGHVATSPTGDGVATPIGDAGGDVAERATGAVLTRAGKGVLAGSVLLYGAAFALGYPEPVVLASGGVIGLIVALLWTLPRAKLEVGREVTPLKVSRGEAAVAVLRVHNQGRLALIGLRARDRIGAAEHVVELPTLRGGRARVVSYPLPTDTRGEIEVGPLAVVREDPFGLTRNVTEYGEDARLLVRPRVVPLGVLPSGRARHLEGPSGDRAPSGTATFHTLREYVPGDDLRHVHWRSTARTGTLMVRRLVDASLPVTTVALDTRAASAEACAGIGSEAGSAAGALFELAVDVAASVAAGAARAGFPVRVVTGERVLLDLRGGAGDVEAVLDGLALVGLSDDPGADPVRLARPGGSLVVVTGDPSAVAGVAAARRRHERTVCLRVAPRGGPVSVPGVTIVDVPDLETLATAWTGAAR